MKKRAKLSDVAKLAGVSDATVSRVLNGNTSVDPALVAKVNAAKLELGYRRNSLARGLRRMENNVVGVVIPDVTNPFFTDIVRGIEDSLNSRGYLLVLCNTDETVEKEAAYMQLLVDQHVAGVIVTPVLEESSVNLVGAASDIPLVTVDRKVKDGGIDCVILDNVEGAEMLTRQLLEHSHSIAMIAGPNGSTTADSRLQGFRNVLAAMGVDAGAVPIISSDYSEMGGYQAAQELLSLKELPKAIFSANNLMAIGLLRALAEKKVSAEDIFVASFDPLPWSEGSQYRVATLDVPTYELGKVAAELLLGRIDGDVAPAKEIVLKVGQS